MRVDVQVAYVNPPTLAKAMLLDAARNTPGVLEEPAPYVAVTQIDDPLMGYLSDRTRTRLGRRRDGGVTACRR